VQEGRKATRTKEVKKLMKRKKASGGGGAIATSPFTTWSGEAAATVGVQMPAGAGSKDVKVDGTTTAWSVLEAVGCVESVLEEQGGNIGSRRLDNRALILPLLRVNGAATLYVGTPAPELRLI
jgi:hypothetical protein